MEDNCPDDPPEIPDDWRRRVDRHLGHLTHELEQIMQALKDRFE